MGRRFWYFVLVLAIAVVVLSPRLIRADDGLTLESLAEKIESLFQGQSGLQSRVEAIETQLAPTPTKTSRPIPPATITAQARSTRNAARVQVTATARAQSMARARVTATAQAIAREESREANATATARARYRATQVAQANAKSTAATKEQQGPTAAEVATYNRATEPVVEVLLEGLFGAATLFEDPKYNDSVWEFKMEGYLNQIQEAWFLALRIDPPASLESVHKTFMQGLDECLEGANNAIDGIVYSDADKLESAFEPFKRCGQLVQKASDMLDTMQR